jgi:hypothetical protein
MIWKIKKLRIKNKNIVKVRLKKEIVFNQLIR